MNDTYVALDLEATGMDASRHEIIEVAIVLFGPDGIGDRYSTLVRPQQRLSLDISSLTGIAAAELAVAPTFGEIAPVIRRMLAGRPIVGQSVWMDVAMIEAAGIVVTNEVYDTYDLATLLLPNLPTYTLASVATRLGIAASDKHRALADAELTAQVFRALLGRLKEYDSTTLEQLALLLVAGESPLAGLIDGLIASRPSGPLFAVGDEDDHRGPHELAFLVPKDRPEPLRRTGSARSIDLDRVRATLAGRGPLGDVLRGFEYRPQQAAMAVAVGEALDRDDRLLVEAGTGTGKSIAYLLPAVMHATERGEPVVVSTATLALQDQLHQKDVPDLRAALAASDPPLQFNAAVLKGRQNYLCLRRWFGMQRQPVISPWEARLRSKVLMWIGDTETGDRAELRLTPEEEGLWRNLAEEEEACVASRCVYQQRNQCFLYRARRRAEQAHLVIVNHALLLSDVVAGSRVLPEYDRLIIDEAHHLEDQATAQFGFAVDARAIGEYLDDTVKLDGPTVGGALGVVAAYLARQGDDDAARRRTAAATDRLRQALEAADAGRSTAIRLFGALFDLVARGNDYGGGYDRTLRITNSVRRDGGWLEVEILWEPLDTAMRELDGHIRWFMEAIERIEPDDDEASERLHQEMEIQLGLALKNGADLAVRLQSAIGLPQADLVYWIERSAVGDRASLHAAPLHVGETLRDQLFDQVRSLVLTSATITIDGTFDYVRERLGLDDAQELRVASPFDYEASTLLYLADDIPEPNLPGYQRVLNETLIATCEATHGRTLVLFTSHAALQATYKAIKGPLEETGIIVLAQRTDGSPRQLIERLKHAANIVVLGTSTFWEGVDVVGSALSLLVITRLPFSVPSDPIFAARGELFEQPFLDYAVPQAVLRFKQGFGRLIRSSRDRGVCAVLDRRVISKRYGSSFVQSLPECSIRVGSTRDLASAASDWLTGDGWSDRD